MCVIANDIKAGKRLGYSGKPITNIINIGIGGSDLGPKMSLEALKQFANASLNYYFISDADPLSFKQVIQQIDIETSLFIVVSKSFSTIETLINAQQAMALYECQTQIDQHFVAVTANPSKAKQFGLSSILPIWQWVGGRFSFCSAVNLILMIAIGKQHFLKMLSCAHAMDLHFRQTDIEKNMPMMMALLSIFNVNVRDIQMHSVLVYNNRLKYFPEFLQQLQMESNGKSMNMWGEKIDYKTSPVVWGRLEIAHNTLITNCWFKAPKKYHYTRDL